MPLVSLFDLESVYAWCCTLRQNYSHNNDIWDLRRHWDTIKHTFLTQMNAGTYVFNALDVYVHEDVSIYLWSSLDMMALKLISNALSSTISIPKTCYHTKGNGGLKKAATCTSTKLPNYTYVFRSDVKSFYESIDFGVLMGIVERYIKDPVLLTLLRRALMRAENSGGNFTFYDTHGLPMGSPLSPLLGAIMLMPLDHAMGKIKDVFYARYMDDWIILTKSKTQLRKVIKKTHKIMKDLKLSLHPTKTYIGKILSGFNFLGYYMDGRKLLPSTETIRRMTERASALYEQEVQSKGKRKGQKKRRYTPPHKRDTSEYYVNEPRPNDTEWFTKLNSILERCKHNPKLCNSMRRYFNRWLSWLKLGLGVCKSFLETSCLTFLPNLMMLNQ